MANTVLGRLRTLEVKQSLLASYRLTLSILILWSAVLVVKVVIRVGLSGCTLWFIMTVLGLLLLVWTCKALIMVVLTVLVSLGLKALGMMFCMLQVPTVVARIFLGTGGTVTFEWQ